MSSATAARALAAPAALVRAVPAWVWLAGIVAVSAAVRFGVGRRMIAPWIMVDELIYSELARSFAATGSFLLRGEPVGVGYGAIYPALLSPAFLLDSIPEAYTTAKAINAVVISLAAVPAYLLARRVASQPLALVAAGLSLAVPSMFYAGTIMTENAFYPVFLAVSLALVLALERPTPLRVAVLLASVGVAFLARTQAVVFVPAIATAPLVLAAWRRRPAVLADYRWLYAGLFAGGGGVLAVAAATGRKPLDLLGAYKAAGQQDYRIAEVARWLLYHAGEFDLYVGVAPVAAFLLLLLRVRSLEPREQAFLAAAAALSLWLLLQVAAFATQPSVLRIEERNMFYLAPLLFAALVLWIERGLPRPPLATAVAAAVAVALPAFVPYARLIGVSATSDTLALLPLWTLHETAGLLLERVWIAVVLGAAAIALVFAFVPRRFAFVLPAVVLLLYGLAAQPIDARTRQASIGHLFQGITRPERDWVDAEIGRDARVAALWTGVTDHLTVFENEFFSRSVHGVYHLRDPLPGALPQSGVGVDEDDGLLRAADGSTIGAPYLLTDDSLPIEGRIVAQDARKGMRVYRLDGPARVSNVVRGLYADLWTEPAFVYRGFRCDEDTLRARLASDSRLYRRPQTVTAEIGGRVVARGRVRPDEEETVLTVPLEQAAGATCVVRFSVSPTAVPAEVQEGSEDTRELGVRILGFDRR